MYNFNLKIYFFKQILLFSLIPIPIVLGQPAPIEYQIVPYSVSSGIHNGPKGSDSPELVWREVIQISDAPWLQLHFGESNLGIGSYIKIISLLDGSLQQLNTLTLSQWYNTSAYFNGEAVELQLFVDSFDEGIFIETIEIVIGEQPGNNIQTDFICDEEDDRVSSSDSAVGRIMTVGCTGWIASNGKIVSAGHCLNGSSATILQFQVPPSLPNGTPQHPGPEDQYSIDQQSILYQDDGIGNDWAVFNVFVNTETNLPPIVAQNSYYLVEQSVTGPTLRVIGYGVDGPPPTYGFGNSERNSDSQTQQTDDGPKHESSSGTLVTYVIDVMGGTSGGPVIDISTETAKGIHTHADCLLGEYNMGTSTVHTGFWDALTSLLPILCINPEYWFPTGENEDIYVELLNCGFGEEFKVLIEPEVTWLGTYGSAMTGTSTLIASYKNLTGQSRYGRMKFSAETFNGSSPQYLDVYQGLATWLFLPDEQGFIPQNNHCIITQEAYLGNEFDPYEISDQGDIPYLTVTAGNQIYLLPGFKASPSETNQFIAEIQEVILNDNDTLKFAGVHLSKPNINESYATTTDNKQEGELNKSQSSETKVEIPYRYGLSQNYPNPFNPTTTIRYQLPVDSKVTIKLYDILGREVAILVNEVQDAGYKEVRFDASSLSSGIYIFNLVAGDFISSKKMIVMK